MIHEKIHNTRYDYLHKISHEIISENQVIITEDLQIKNMVKNHNLSSSIIDASWNILLNQFKYKSEWYGRKYVTVDKFYSSSQICSNCGYKNSNVKDLSIVMEADISSNEEYKNATDKNEVINRAKKDLEESSKYSSVKVNGTKFSMTYNVKDINQYGSKYDQVKKYMEKLKYTCK